MVNDIKIPDFNLEDSFSIDGENTPTPPKKKTKVEDEQPVEEGTAKAATPAAAAAAPPEATKQKPKPKLLFEEEEESVEILNPPATFVKLDTKKAEEPLKQKAKPPEKQKPAKPEKPVKVKIKKERKPMKLKYILIPLVVIVLGGGAFFAYTNGYVGRLVSKVSDIKNSFFATDSLAIADGDGHNEDEDAEEAKEQEKPKVSSPYENEFLRKPATTQQNKTTTAAKPAPTPAKTTTPAATTPEKTSTHAKTTTSASTPAKTTTPTKTTTTSTTYTDLGIPGTYSIQVCAWQEERTAKNEVRKIADNRLAARVVSVNLGQRGTWYRVMVGSYATEDEARRDLNRVMRTTGYENCIVREN
jgi:cell division septation protein DedD